MVDVKRVICIKETECNCIRSVKKCRKTEIGAHFQVQWAMKVSIGELFCAKLLIALCGLNSIKLSLSKLYSLIHEEVLSISTWNQSMA